MDNCQYNNQKSGRDLPRGNFRYLCYFGIVGPIYLFLSALFQPDIPLFPWSDLTYQEQLDLYPGELNGRSNLATYPMFLYIVHPYF